jgi:hypothetical protein
VVLDLEVVNVPLEVDLDALVKIFNANVLDLDVNAIAFKVNGDVFEVVVLVLSVEGLVSEANIDEVLLLNTAKFIRPVNAYPSDEVKFKAAELG